MARMLGIAWGLLVASPLARRARAQCASRRVADLRARGRDVRPRARWRSWLETLRPLVRVVEREFAAVAARRSRRVADAELARELPVVVDLVGVAVSAGCTPYLAVEMAAEWGPPRSAAAFAAVMDAVRLGRGFDVALGDLARGLGALRPLVDALLVTDRTGAPLGTRLAGVADQQRTALRRRAEVQARRVPVRLLFPLVFLVLPAFVLLTVMPSLLAGLARL